MPTPRAHGNCHERLLTRPGARALGFTDARIDTLLRSKRWHSPFPGVLATTVAPLPYGDLCRACLLAVRRPAVLSHTSAARLWKLPDIPRPAGIELTLPPPITQRQPPGLRLHWPLLDPDDTTVLDGIACTTVARTVADVGRDARSRHWAVVLADAALQRGLVSLDDLASAAGRIADPQHRRMAQRAVELADGGSLSPQESRVRLILVESGLPAPATNWPLFDENGRLLAVGDMVYRRQLVWLEYDGYDVHSQRRAFRADRVRERRIRERGFDVLRLVDEDLHNPAALVALVATKLDAAPERISRLAASTSPEVAQARAALGLRT